MSLVLDVISKLNENGISYCIFKEFDLIYKTLKGEEDIDFLIAEKDIKKVNEILKSLGYKKCIWPKYHFGISFYMGYDKDNGCMSMLHIHTKLRIGYKMEKELHWKKLEKRILSDFFVEPSFGAHVIRTEDEIILLFVRMILRKHPNKDDYNRLNELLKIENINEVPFSGELKLMLGLGREAQINVNDYISDVYFGNDTERQNIRRYLRSGLSNSIATVVRFMWGKLHRAFLGVRYRMKFPQRPIRHVGKIYAIVGVDGCGKSTMVDELLHDDYLKLIGFRRIYGGNNEYWIPGLQKKMSSGKRNMVINSLCRIDKRLRIVKALFIALTGCNVIFDRYYYDDYIGYILAKERKDSFAKLIVKKLLFGWIGIRPYRTFFLDVNPDVAFSRKQDYSYEKLCANIDAYRKVLKSRKEVEILNAQATVEENKRHIVSVISR